MPFWIPVAMVASAAITAYAQNNAQNKAIEAQQEAQENAPLPPMHPDQTPSMFSGMNAAPSQGLMQQQQAQAPPPSAYSEGLLAQNESDRMRAEQKMMRSIRQMPQQSSEEYMAQPPPQQMQPSTPYRNQENIPPYMNYSGGFGGYAY